MSAATEQKTILTLSRTFFAPRERVFTAWTEPEQIKRWFGPGACEVVEAIVDLRVGGKYRFRATSPEMGEFSLRGEFREVAPPAKLVYTWQFEDDPDYLNRETLVTIEFLDRGGSTEVRLTHENLPSADSVKNHEHGWNGSFDKLEKLL